MNPMKAVFLLTITLLALTNATHHCKFNEYDFIIVGGGTSGSMLALKLSENPNACVALIERAAGEFDSFTAIPMLNYVLNLFTTNLGNQVITPGGLPSTEYWQTLEAFMLSGYKDVVIPWFPGGGPAVSADIFTPPSPDLMNLWANLVNDTSFNSTNFLKYLQSCENVSYNLTNSTVRGRSGPIQVSWQDMNDSVIAPRIAELSAQFGVSYMKDYMDSWVTGSSVHMRGIFPMQRSIVYGSCTPFTGPCTRSSVYSSGILPILSSRPNLSVILSSAVTKINFKSTTKIEGVTILQQGETVNLKSDYVILSAGAINSPKLLQISGIGDASLLTSVGIDVKINNTNVGQLSDQYQGLLIYYNPVGEKIVNPSATPIMFVNSGAYGIINDIEIGLFAAPTSILGQPTAPGHVLIFYPIQLLNTSIVPGYVKIRSDQIMEKPNLSRNFNAFTNMAPLTWAMRNILAIAQPHISAGDWIDLSIAGKPSGLNVNSTDTDIQVFLDLHGLSWQHPVSSNPMGTLAQNSVVNSKFQVWGTDNLFVCDLSVLPKTLQGNSHPSFLAAALGSKCAEYLGSLPTN
jgi:choline dehydrogenase